MCIATYQDWLYFVHVFFFAKQYAFWFVIPKMNVQVNRPITARFNNWSKKSVLLPVHTHSKNYVYFSYNAKTTKNWKTFLILYFFKTSVTQNHNSAFNKGFYLRQAVSCSLPLDEKEKCIHDHVCKKPIMRTY